MIKSQNMGDSPRAEGESLRATKWHPKEAQRCCDIEGCATTEQGDVPEGKNSPGKQFFLNLSPLVPALLVRLRAFDESLYNTREKRVFFHDITTTIETAKKNSSFCSDDSCKCSYHSILKLATELEYGLGDLYQERIALETRAARKIMKLYREDRLGAIGYNRIKLAVSRLYMLDSLSLVCDPEELRLLIFEISELNWRYE